MFLCTYDLSFDATTSTPNSNGGFLDWKIFKVLSIVIVLFSQMPNDEWRDRCDGCLLSSSLVHTQGATYWERDPQSRFHKWVFTISNFTKKKFNQFYGHSNVQENFSIIFNYIFWEFRLILLDIYYQKFIILTHRCAQWEFQ